MSMKRARLIPAGIGELEIHETAGLGVSGYLRGGNALCHSSRRVIISARVGL